MSHGDKGRRPQNRAPLFFALDVFFSTWLWCGLWVRAFHRVGVWVLICCEVQVNDSFLHSVRRSHSLLEHMQIVSLTRFAAVRP